MAQESHWIAIRLVGVVRVTLPLQVLISKTALELELELSASSPQWTCSLTHCGSARESVV